MQELLDTPLDNDPVVTKIDLKAPPERVFRAWTQAEEIKSWFGPEPFTLEEVFIDLRVGGEWRFVFNTSEVSYSAVTGKYLHIEADSRLVFSWSHEKANQEGFIEAGVVSEVQVSIQPQGSGSILTVVHSKLATPEGRASVTRGWACSLESLSKIFFNSSEPVSGRVGPDSDK